ncbi:tubby C-terminal domain-like protein [Staphylococcus shinii]|jgi:hypothetical protein|uniref:Tubby C-terminal domain-containing protein n=1 Tax=Staphylococcus shinii TaxID=2912228 RepID=A0A418IIM5_9STAP|nr:hypothetical protein [Staphylococcus shinii]MDW8565907.1 hypothetical protein [Staphylococcus shinii]MDW8566414.1 hypothetical protein [Staphylococcus shinii]PTI64296.1 hypothetical protein BU110_10290 [Staphylococcus shinii]RIN02647.1 hypothetical protein BU112_02040 [Staphylococcus shinii]RIN09196.1 hypothetical protein BU101_03715 [Staphylococcus shinii]
MTHYYFKENFFNASKSIIDIYDDTKEVAFKLQLFYTSAGQEAMALFGNSKQNFEITDGHDTFRILQERTISGAIKTPFKTVWQVEKNGEKIGIFRSKMGFKPSMQFEGDKGDILKFQSGFFSRSVTVSDGHYKLMQTKSERFKLASRHDLYIETKTYNPAMLIMLFQVFYEFQEQQRRNSN